MAYKLIKVAKEFNVGLETIVKSLHEKGFNEVESKPNSDISDTMYGVLCKEFQKEIAIKHEAEKLVRPSARKELGELGKPALPPLGPLPPLPKKDPPVKAEPAPLAPLGTLPPLPKPVVTQSETNPSTVEGSSADNKPQVISARRESLGGLNIVGKIDLPDPKANKPQAPANKTGNRPNTGNNSDRRQEGNRNQGGTNNNSNNNNRRDDNRNRQGGNPQGNNDNRGGNRQNNPANNQGNRPQQDRPQPPRNPMPQQPPTLKLHDRIFGEADPNAVAPEETIRAEAPQLRGLKILGKVDTDKINEREKEAANRSKLQRKERERDRNRRPDGTAPRPAGTPGTPGTTNPNAPLSAADAEKRRRRRTKVAGPPITAENLQRTITSTARDNNNNNRRPGPQQGTNTTGGTGAAGGNRPAPAKRGEPKVVSQKDIEDQIKATMARLDHNSKNKRQKIRRGKRDEMREKQEIADRRRSEEDSKLLVTEFISAAELASLMNVSAAEIIKTCMTLGYFVNLNQRLDAEVIEIVASEFGHEVQFISAEEQVEVVEDIIDTPEDLVPRQPIVTVMGHVDHGKTSLLDFIRKANVMGGEAGGITQHIGAYEVAVGGDQTKRITFLDTPGHEAFTAMRARGAKVTDVAIIVIAADDNIMPQTKEAISHAQAAGVPIIFAINKIDRPGADPEKIKAALAQMNFLVEDWGGNYQSQDISAKMGTNVDKLLEKVLLESEILDLRANPNRRATGTVLEASMEKGRGYATKVLIQTGTIKIGDPILAGEYSGRVKAMFNERNQAVKTAKPSQPVMILGLPGAPQAGELLRVPHSEAEAKEIAAKRAQILREQSARASRRISLDEIGRRLALGNFKELNLIVKGDVDGSVEALSDSLLKLGIERVQVNIIHKAVGQIIDSDIMLASASDAIIIGFQVRPSLTARRLAENEGVEIKTYSVIYEAIDEVKAAIEGLLEPTKVEEIVATVEVREIYKAAKIGTIAGCYVQDGKLTRQNYVRVIRDGIIVFPYNENTNAELGSLKHIKDDIKEARWKTECGLTIKNFNDIRVGDTIEAYVINEVKGKL